MTIIGPRRQIQHPHTMQSVDQTNLIFKVFIIKTNFRTMKFRRESTKVHKLFAPFMCSSEGFEGTFGTYAQSVVSLPHGANNPSINISFTRQPVCDCESLWSENMWQSAEVELGVFYGRFRVRTKIHCAIVKRTLLDIKNIAANSHNARRF